MKYFCVTETISLYIQKYVQYRKRKVFFGNTGKIDDLIPVMMKHKQEKYLVPLSSVHNDDIKNKLDAKGLNHTECVMYRTLSNNFTPEEVKNFDCDMLIFSTPTGVNYLTQSFPNVKDGTLKLGAFGPATGKAIEKAIHLLREAGIGNISIDLMFGFPNETIQEWQQDIEQRHDEGC